jgi:F-type H+-transporting ATPase subunit delta
MSLGKSYARALYEASKGAGNADQVEKDMESFVGLLNQSQDLKKTLLGPVVTAKEKSGVLTAIASKAGYSKGFQNFLSLLAAKERLPAIFEIHDAFSGVRLEAEGGVAGRLVSAEPLSDADAQGLAQAFSKKIGKKVEFRVSTDPSLLAGMKVTVNGVTYDGSLKSQLQQLRDKVMSGYSAN